MNIVPPTWKFRFEREFGELAPSELEREGSWENRFVRASHIRQNLHLPLTTDGVFRNPPVLIFSTDEQGPRFFPLKEWTSKPRSLIVRAFRKASYHLNIYHYSSLKKVMAIANRHWKIAQELSAVPIDSLSQLWSRYTRLFQMQEYILCSHLFLETSTVDDLISSKDFDCIDYERRLPQEIVQGLLAIPIAIAACKSPSTAWDLGPMIFPIMKLRKIYNDLNEAMKRVSATTIPLGSTFILLGKNGCQRVSIRGGIVPISHEGYHIDGKGNPRSCTPALKAVFRFSLFFGDTYLGSIDLSRSHQLVPTLPPVPQWVGSVEDPSLFPYHTIVGKIDIDAEEGTKEIFLTLLQIKEEIEQQEKPWANRAADPLFYGHSLPLNLEQKASWIADPAHLPLIRERIQKEPLLNPDFLPLPSLYLIGELEEF